MISDERRYGDRIQAHMRWLSCTARECGPAAQRDMERWVSALCGNRRGSAGAAAVRGAWFEEVVVP